MGQAPDLDNGPVTAAPASRRRRFGWAGILVLLAIVIVMAALGHYNRDLLIDQVRQWADRPAAQDPVPEPLVVAQETESDDEEGRHSPATATDGSETRQVDREAVATSRDQMRERIVSDPQQIETELERLVAEQQGSDPDSEAEPPPVVDRRAPRSVDPRPPIVVDAPTRQQRAAETEIEDERLAELQRQIADTQRRASAESTASAAPRREPRPEPDSSPEQLASATRPAEQPWSPQAADYIRSWELPLSVRRNMPDLKLNIHVFAEEAHQRFVLVNGRRFVPGDMISDGVQLVDIRREGAVVDFRDYRFLLEP
jgi:general secretion pathway protein B